MDKALRCHFRRSLVALLLLVYPLQGVVEVGIDRFFVEGYDRALEGKRVGLITNQTGVNSKLESTLSLLERSPHLKLVALFSPEHGLTGVHAAGEKVADSHHRAIPVYSLHGATKRPTQEMLTGLDCLIYDIQDSGARSYTYASTLFYVMEEAAKCGLPLMVLDRPNPAGGSVVDGPMLEDQRSFLGYLNVPYCHGMTMGELALFFNQEYKIGCKLTVVPMHGYHRSMIFADTGLTWIPTSPHMPESDTPLYSLMTGILGELSLVSIGVGYTLPFKVVGAPWIDANQYAAKLAAQNFPGVAFLPFHFRPFYGLYKGEECHGVRIVVTDAQRCHPVSVYCLLLGMLKSLYPKEVNSLLKATPDSKRKLYTQVIGSSHEWQLLIDEPLLTWKLIERHKKSREGFLDKRKRYLLYPD